jgi:hypothetical protein
VIVHAERELHYRETTASGLGLYLRIPKQKKLKVLATYVTSGRAYSSTMTTDSMITGSAGTS